MAISQVSSAPARPGYPGVDPVVGVAADGGKESPYDRSTAVDTDEPVRVVLIREAIDNTGATDMPDLVHPRRLDRRRGQPVSPDDQARFVESAIRRARSEWPWVGLIFNWTLNVEPEVPNSANLALIVNGNQTPLYTAMSGFAKSSFGASITNGFVPANASACDYSGNWQDQHLTEGIYRTVRDPTSAVTCRFWGTGISAFFRFSPDCRDRDGTRSTAQISNSASNRNSGQRGPEIPGAGTPGTGCAGVGLV